MNDSGVIDSPRALGARDPELPAIIGMSIVIEGTWRPVLAGTPALGLRRATGNASVASGALEGALMEGKRVRNTLMASTHDTQ